MTRVTQGLCLDLRDVLIRITNIGHDSAQLKYSIWLCGHMSPVFIANQFTRHHTLITGCFIVCEAVLAFKTFVSNSPLLETRTLAGLDPPYPILLYFLGIGGRKNKILFLDFGA